MTEIILRPIRANENKDVYEMFQEIPAEENGFYNTAHGLTEEEFKNFCKKRVESSQGINLKEGFVPDTYYLLMADNYPVGIAKLRHYLNEALSKRGGHIGYCIRPSSRGQKFGNIILQKVLEQAKLKNIDRVLLTIREDNIPSRKACEHNGGKLEKIQYIENNNVCFYWIDLSQNKK